MRIRRVHVRGGGAGHSRGHFTYNLRRRMLRCACKGCIGWKSHRFWGYRGEGSLCTGVGKMCRGDWDKDTIFPRCRFSADGRIVSNNFGLRCRAGCAHAQSPKNPCKVWGANWVYSICKGWACMVWRALRRVWIGSYTYRCKADRHRLAGVGKNFYSVWWARHAAWKTCPGNYPYQLRFTKSRW